MINTHKELISEIKNFANKFEFINGFKYVKDVATLEDELMNLNPRIFVIGLESMTLDEEKYNMDLTYRFAFSEEVQDDEDAVINAESENLFCVSALSDYLKHIADTPISLDDVTTNIDSDGNSIYCSAYGTFVFTIKRNPSYWKKMEAYSV